MAQIHAIIDKKLGPKKSGGRDSPTEDISSYCLSKEKQTLLSKTQKIQSTLKSRYEPPRRIQIKEHADFSERKVTSGGKRNELADSRKNDGGDDDSTPEGSSDNESVDTQKDVSELPCGEVTTFVDNDHIEDTAKVEKQDSQLEVKQETVPDEAKPGAEYYDIENEMSRQC